MSAELKVVAWLTSWQKDRFRTAGSIVSKLEPPQKFDCNQYDPLVCLSHVDTEIAALKEDAERYRLLRRGQRWSVIDGIGDTLRAEALDAAIDSARAAGDGEGKR